MSFPLFPFCGIRCRRTRSDLFQLKVARDSTGRSVQFLVAVVGFHQRVAEQVALQAVTVVRKVYPVGPGQSGPVPPLHRSVAPGHRIEIPHGQSVPPGGLYMTHLWYDDGEVTFDA